MLEGTKKEKREADMEDGKTPKQIPWTLHFCLVYSWLCQGYLPLLYGMLDQVDDNKLVTHSLIPTIPKLPEADTGVPIGASLRATLQ